MIGNQEINALLYLIEDPDEEVFNSVSDKLVSMGKSILPNLESLWENTPDQALQHRIEMIIHKLHFRDLTAEFKEWNSETPDLLQGALLVSRYLYPELSTVKTIQEIEKLRRNTWLELNSYQTALEQTSVLSAIIYNYYKIEGNAISYTSPDDFLLPKLIESKKGNVIATGILYIILCQLLDIPIAPTRIPRQFILGFFSTEYKYPDPVNRTAEQILFYIDPLNGQVYSQKDIENYFASAGVEIRQEYFQPADVKSTMKFFLEELAKCFDSPNNLYKKNDLLSLARELDEKDTEE